MQYSECTYKTIIKIIIIYIENYKQLSSKGLVELING